MFENSVDQRGNIIVEQVHHFVGAHTRTQFGKAANI